MILNVRDGPRTIEAIIFDLDGTLIESTIDFKLMRDRVIEALLANGMPRDLVSEKGNINENIVRGWGYFLQNHDRERLMALEDELNRVSAEVEMRDVWRTKMVPGTTDLIDSLRGMGISTAVLTRGSREYTMKALEASGIGNGFDFILCRDDHPLMEAKPNPISLQRVAEAIDVPESKCLFVGDHRTDFDCARAAGVEFVAVLTGSHDKAEWEGLNVELIVDSIADIIDIMG